MTFCFQLEDAQREGEKLRKESKLPFPTEVVSTASILFNFVLVFLFCFFVSSFSHNNCSINYIKIIIIHGERAYLLIYLLMQVIREVHKRKKKEVKQ